MKILYSTDQIYLHGGIEKVMAEKANYFVDVLGYEVYILTTEQKGKLPCYPLSDKITLVDIAVNYARSKTYFHPENLKKIPSHFSRYKAAIQQIQPDIIISCNYAFDFYWLPFTFRNISKLKEYHSSRYFEDENRKNAGFLSSLKYKLNDFIESKFTWLVLLNPDELKFYRTSNKVIIPNPIKIGDKSNNSVRAKRVIAAGRIAPVKRFDLMIHAWKSVNEQCPDWQLVIFGDGEPHYLDYLQGLLLQLNLQHVVSIQPATKELQNEFLKSSFYLMTSKTECYPMVLLEAMDCGLPVVTYDSPTGPRNIVTHDSDGIVVDYNNEALLIEKIVFLIHNDEKRLAMSASAIQKARSFSVESVMVQWQLLLHQLIK